MEGRSPDHGKTYTDCIWPLVTDQAQRRRRRMLILPILQCCSDSIALLGDCSMHGDDVTVMRSFSHHHDDVAVSLTILLTSPHSPRPSHRPGLLSLRPFCPSSRLTHSLTASLTIFCTYPYAPRLPYSECDILPTIITHIPYPPNLPTPTHCSHIHSISYPPTSPKVPTAPIYSTHPISHHQPLQPHTLPSHFLQIIYLST